MKLTSISSEIESLENEIILSQSEVASMLAVEALERSNKENAALKQQV